MAIRSRFFDAVEVEGVPDRLYTAEEWAHMLRPLISDGRVDPTGLQVTETSPASANTVLVTVGAAWADGRSAEVYDESEELTLLARPTTNPRIDLVVLRRNNSDRVVELGYVQGTEASSPSAPSVTQDSDIWEVALAEVARTTTETSVEDSAITNLNSAAIVQGTGGITIAETVHNSTPQGSIVGSLVDLTGMTLTADIDPTRRYRLESKLHFECSVDFRAIIVYFRIGTTTIARAGRRGVVDAGAPGTEQVESAFEFNPNDVAGGISGSTTFKLSAERAGANGTITISHDVDPGVLRLKDAGPAWS